MTDEALLLAARIASAPTRQRLRFLCITLIVAIAHAGCGGDTPSLASRNCRRYATVLLYGPEGSQATRECTFASNRYSCRTGFGGCASESWSYSTLDDFIEEARTPNRARWSEWSSAYQCGFVTTDSSGSVRYTYDAQKRLLKSGDSCFYEYTAWDNRGRPTRGSFSCRTPSDVSIVYDDATRTKTTSFGWSSEDYIEQQDEYGNTIRTGSRIYTVSSMSEVCR